MPKPTELRVVHADGFVFVAGTADASTASAFLSTWRNPEEVWCYDHDRDDCPCPSDPCPPGDPRSTWLRVVPGCPGWCGEGHPSHYIDANPGSRGAFPAVVWYS